MPQELQSKNSAVYISTKHCKDGENSLCWEIEENAQLSIQTEIGYHPFVEGSLDQARDSFVFWIYCEKPIPELLEIQFKKNGKLCCSFPFSLSFTGWRTAWVPFEQMDGNPEIGMDELCIEAKFTQKAVLYLDQIVLCVPIDPRHPARDCQAPFVNIAADKAVNSHWMSLYRFSLLMKDALSPLHSGIAENREDILLIEKRFEEYILTHSRYPKNGTILINDEQMDQLRSAYQRFCIVETQEGIKGITIDAACHKASYPKDQREALTKLTNSIDIKECSSIMLDTAYAWYAADSDQKKELAALYCKLFRHLLDQGWAYGSCQGTTHHLGYPMRCYYYSVFLMREPLREAGILQKAAKAIAWYSGCGRIFREDREIHGESMDTLNTLLHGILASILLIENNQEKSVCLKAFSHWLSVCMQPAPGLRGPFKVDGSAFHHCNHYPAYAMGGLNGAAPVVYFLSRTEYQIEAPAHATIRKALLTMRLYCNRYNWLVSMSSRHPKGVGEMSQISTLEPFYYMAIAGSPDYKKEIDREMAEACLRLAEYTEFEPAKMLEKLGYQKESEPSGHVTMNYACASLHRRDNWLAGVRGHSRYLWGDEIYVSNNLYGRYITYGNLQILCKGEPVNNTDSGFFQEGWDWNCWPGTTAVHLPWSLLKADVRNVDTLSGFEEMLLSDESFAGGTHIEGKNGIFAMKLHSHAKYDDSQRARKSYFFFDNKIICLGSGIENNNTEYETYTTLFQNYLVNREDPIYLNSADAVTNLDYRWENQAQQSIYIIDNVGNGYYIPEGQTVVVTREEQESRSQNFDEPTRAPFAKACINHGINPKKDMYEYCIFVQCKDETLREIAQNSKDRLPYTVLSHNDQAHIVLDKDTATVAYVFFEAQPNVSFGYVQSVDRPCLVMEQKQDKKLQLSICDPDLRLYEGQEADQIDKDGRQREVSLYSRTWRTNESMEKELTVRIKGHWEILNSEKAAISYQENTTILKIMCKDGKTFEILLNSK